MKNNELEILGISVKHIKNENEKVVAKAIAELIGVFPKQCRCQTCLEDVYGYVLNNLAPKYKHIRSRRLKMDKASVTEIENLVIKGFKQIKSNPHH
jgi:hypothetical protein